MNNIYAIACVDKNGYYAEKDGGPLPWPHTAGDLDWFQYLTKNNIVIVGSETWKTLQALPPLKNREVWAVGRDYELKSVYDSVEKFKNEGNGRDLFVGGGQKLWDEFGPYYNAIYTTYLKDSYVTDGKILNMKAYRTDNNLIIDKAKYQIYKQTRN